MNDQIRENAFNNSNDRKKYLFILILFFSVIILSVFCLLNGSANLSLDNILNLVGSKIGLAQFELLPRWKSSILFDIRMPRVLIAILAGASLALSGVVMQGMFRNPLASPSVLGVSSGASLGAVIAIYFGFSLYSSWSIPICAFIGALISLTIVYSVATNRGLIRVSTLILAGVAISALNGAILSLILALSLNEWDLARSIIYWTMGGLEGRSWDHVFIILPIILTGFISLLFYAKSLDLLLLGEQHALSVGVDIVKTRRNLLIIVTLMVGGSVSVVGGIGFIGLVVPHILRLILGPSHKYLIPASLFGGAFILLLADLSIHTIFIDNAIPIGVITAALGAPFFLFLLLKQSITIKQ